MTLIAHIAPSTSTALLPTSGLLSKGQPQTHFSGASVTTEWRHFSLLLYLVPTERARALIPRSFELAELTLRGRKLALLSVTSFMDHGHQAASGEGNGLTAFCDAFEQTNYCLRVRRDGEACDWLLGMSLGSLAAIAPRGLWPLPWHLSAMAFQVNYALGARRYHTYHVQTQSQWANACWRLRDTGLPLADDWHFATSDCPTLLPQEMTTYFTRRDGAIGAYRTEISPLACTRGHLEFAECDWLERIGLLNKDEIAHPYLVALQPSLTCRMFLPSTPNFEKELL
jgi:hypothetical protein